MRRGGNYPDKGPRGQERAALEGALDQIAPLGGLVDAISEVTVERQAQGRFLFSATVKLSSRTASPPSVKSAARLKS